MRKNKSLIICALCVCMICGMATTVGVMKRAAENASSDIEYVNDDVSDIMEHDGEVLVDSLKIRKIEDNTSGSAMTSESAVLSQTVTSDDLSDIEDADEYFAEVRATVDIDRNQIISMLSDVIAETETQQEKENATKQKLQIIDYMNKEKLIENIIATKGLPECLVLMSDNAVNVTVNKQELTQSDVAKICDIIMRETGRDAGQIVIQSKY